MPWDPVRDLLSMQERLESLFGRATAAWSPPVDLVELTDRYIVSVELPGLTREAVERTYRREASQEQRSEEEALAAKLQLLNEMIVQELLLAKAQELKIEVDATELDNAYNEAKKNITDDQFQKELSSRNLTAEDMRESLRRDLLANKVIDREVSSKVAVTDQDITAFFEANKAQFNRTEDAYHIAQIVVTPVREAQRTNRSGNDAGTPQEAQAKAAMLMERLKGGANFAELAADFSEDVQTAQRGGDLALYRSRRSRTCRRSCGTRCCRRSQATSAS